MLLMIWKQAQEEQVILKLSSYAGPMVVLWSTSWRGGVCQAYSLLYREDLKQCEGFPEERHGGNSSLFLVHE